MLPTFRGLVDGLADEAVASDPPAHQDFVHDPAAEDHLETRKESIKMKARSNNP